MCVTGRDELVTRRSELFERDQNDVQQLKKKRKRRKERGRGTGDNVSRLEEFSAANGVGILKNELSALREVALAEGSGVAGGGGELIEDDGVGFGVL